MKLSPARKGVRRQLKSMNDAIFVLTVVAFFVISGLYVRFCEKL